MRDWIFLILAILSEVLGTTCMKLSVGFTNLIPSVLLFIFYAVSFFLLTLALKTIDVSIAYAIWSGLGTATIAIIGFTYFKESVTIVKIAFLLLIIIGVIGLQLASREV